MKYNSFTWYSFCDWYFYIVIIYKNIDLIYIYIYFFVFKTLSYDKYNK